MLGGDNFAAQVSCYRFQIVFAYSWGRAKTIRKRYRGDGNIFENGEKKSPFQTKTDTCGQGINSKVKASININSIDDPSH